MTTEKKVTRRGFLSIAVSAVVVGVVAGVGGYYAGLLSAPPGAITTTTVTAPGAPLTTTVTAPAVTRTVTGPTTTTTVTGSLPPAPRTIKIGATVSVTGMFSTSVGTQEKMYKTWAEMINGRGGLYVKEYGQTLPVQFIIYDDKSDPATVEKYYTKLYTEDKVDVTLGPFTAVNAFPAATLAERYATPHVDLQAAEVPIFNKKWVFGSLDIMPKWLINFMDMLEANGLKPSIAFLNSDEPFGNETQGGGIELAKRYGFEVLTQERYTFETTDFTPIITKLKGLEPDIVSICDPVGILQATFWKQARDLGLKPKGFHACFGSLGPVAEAMGPLSEYVSADLYWHEDLPYEGMWGKSFYDELQKRAGYTDFDWPWVTIAYFGLEMIGRAIESAGSLDKDSLREAFANMYTMLIGGPHRAWKEGGPWFLDDPEFKAVGAGLIRAFPIQWQKGKRVILWPPDVKTGEYIYPAPF